MNEQSLHFLVDASCEGERLDKFLILQCPGYSRSYMQKLITDGNVLVGEKRVKSNYKLHTGDRITVNIPALKELEILPEDIPLDILYEDDDIIVINKGKNMVVHPAPGHYSGTVVNALLYHCRDSLSGINGVMRPGIVHRIDRNTTGAIVICKNDKSHVFIAEQLKEHSITREYHAIVHHAFADSSGTIHTTIGRHPKDRKKMAAGIEGGRDAVTHYQVLDELNRRYTYVSCKLETGRTHQIRVHMASIGHPVLGDDVYGPAKTPFHLDGQALHAKVLGFIHPSTMQYVEFEAPLPEYFTKLLQQLKPNNL